MNPFMQTVAKALRMDSSRAATYLGKGSKNAARINAKIDHHIDHQDQ